MYIAGALEILRYAVVIVGKNSIRRKPYVVLCSNISARLREFSPPNRAAMPGLGYFLVNQLKRLVQNRP